MYPPRVIPAPWGAILFLTILFPVIISLTQSDLLQENSCGLLYNENNFTGLSLEIKDSNSFTNLGEHYLTTDTVWNLTKSLAIKKGCLLTACNESYFDGICQEFTDGISETTQQFDSLLSVNCTCATECKCSDVHMRRTSCAKAYIHKGCNSCNAFYSDLKGSKPFTPETFQGNIKSLIVRAGCSLTLYPEEDYEGEEIVLGNDEENVIEGDWENNIGSYQCVCSEESMRPKTKVPKPRSPESPPYIDIPYSADDIGALLDTELGNLTGIGKHPGLIAALKSVKAKRSPRNAYILLIGLTGAGKSSAINMLFDNENITKVGGMKSTTSDIHEFRIPVPIDHLGIQNSELRVIDTPGLGDTRGLEQDAKFLATLDDYLNSHEELSKRIPNIVLVFGKFHDNRFAGKGAAFVKMLRGVDSFRERITDKKFSNVIFVLSHFMSETRIKRRKPDRQLATFKKVIEDYSLFPKPISIVVAENKAAEQELPMLNGYYQLPNGDFYTRNLFEKIEFATVNGEDPIGEAIIRTAFSDSDDFNISSTTFKLVSSQHTKVVKFLGELSGANFNPVNTEVSQTLATAYESLDSKLARKFPDALPYLQRSFNIRNILTNNDVPRTTLEIVKFMRDIKQNEATLYLMEKAFGLIGPTFSENIITGYGYNIMLDRPLPSTPFKFKEFRNTDIGYLMPNTLTCNIQSISKGIFKVFSNKNEYLKYRLQVLNVEDSVPVESFKGKIQPGSNIDIFHSEPSADTPTVVSAVKEHRTFELVLNDRVSLTDEFINAVTNLTRFNSSDHESVESWSTFFNEYGTHVVKSTHGGGSIEITLTSNQTFGPEIAKAMFQIIEFAEDVTIGRVRNTSFETAGTHHTLKFHGGDPKYHTTNLQSMNSIEAAELLENWKESLSLNPTILMTEMSLLPISEVAKQVGANYSAEIQLAAEQLFNSSLKYLPPLVNLIPKDRQETGENHGSQDFSLIFSAMMENMHKSEERMKALILEIQQNNAKQIEQMEKNREEERKWHEEQQKQAEGRNEAERQRILERIEADEKRYEQEKEMRRIEAERLRQQQRNHEIQLAAARAEAERKRKEVEDAIRNARRGGSCLKKGTKILMADGSEKDVENIQMGQTVFDGNLMPTKVLGISSEFLMTQNFYGFEKDSYFFTDSHLLVGGRDSSSGDLRMYAKSTEMLFDQNPLMEYLDIDDMKGQFEILKFYRNENKVQLKKVSVLKDPVRYPLDTQVYFLQVDNPEGTYIANGFVCRHEVPPMEIWPKTIGLLISIVDSPDARLIAHVKYTLQSLEVFQNIIDGVYYKLEGVLRGADYIVEDENDKEILLEHFDTEKAVGDIFGNPSFSAFAVGLYARCGPALANRLDLDLNGDGSVGTLQKLLREAAVAEISQHVQSDLFKTLQLTK